MKRIWKILNMQVKKEVALWSVIAILVIWTFFLMVQVDSLKKQTFSYEAQAYPYLDPTQNFYHDKDLLINMRPLREELTQLAQGHKVAIYFEFLNTGANIRINDVAYWPGSLMKIPVAMAVMKKIEWGDWTLDTKLTLQDGDKDSGYGDLYKMPSGTPFTVEYLLEQMLVESDNTARSIFMRTAGAQQVADVITYLGLDDVFTAEGKVTPQRYSNLWRALYKSSYISADSSEKLLEIMDMPHDQKLLRQGIPESIPFSHKIGTYYDTYSDSGIIYAPNRPYILTVMMQSSSTAEVDAMMQEISNDVFTYITQ